MSATGINARILKITSLFGGLQGVSILCSVLRSKLVAVWIGTAGIGIFGLLNSALETIFALTQLGIRQSAVRNLASAPPGALLSTVCAVRCWAFWLGIAGTVLTAILSPWLSSVTFGGTGNWWMFAALSVTVFFSSVNNGEAAVFQGLRRFRKLAACSLAGTVGGLTLSIPLFYFWRIDGIVPSFIAYFLCAWIAMGWYREHVPAPASTQTFKANLRIGSRFVTLGLYLTLTSITANLISYAFMAYLNHVGDLELTGCYNAGFTLVNRYAGLVFAAISMEFFPRLSGVATSRHRTGIFVSNQLHMVLTIIVPVATVFIAATPLLIRLLYSGEFMRIEPFVVWGSVGTVLRAVAWCMSFVILARGDGRVFLATELTSGILSLLFNIIGYRLLGFTGLGFAYIAWFFCYSLIVATICLRRYRLRIDRRIIPYLLYASSITAATAFTAHITSTLYALPGVVAAVAISATLLKRLLRR